MLTCPVCSGVLVDRICLRCKMAVPSGCSVEGLRDGEIVEAVLEYLEA